MTLTTVLTPKVIFNKLRVILVTDVYVDARSIPLSSLGVVDVAATDISDNEILAHALSNIACSEKANGWAIKRSTDFVNEYARRTPEGTLSDGGCENPNHLLGSFPCLFLFGKGSYEVERALHVSYDAHAKWSLRYGDKRFRKDFHLIFQVFGVLQ